MNDLSPNELLDAAVPVANSGMSADELVAIAHQLGKDRFESRSAEYDVEAKFPTENYEDLREAGFLALTVPAEYGGLGC